MVKDDSRKLEVPASEIITIEDARIYTLGGIKVQREDLLYSPGDLDYPGLVRPLRSIPLSVYFARFPPSEELNRDFLPDGKKYSQKFDPKAISSMEQGLYISLVSDSLACLTTTFHLAGREVIEDLMQNTGATPNDLKPLKTNYYNVYSKYEGRIGRIRGFSLGYTRLVSS